MSKTYYQLFDVAYDGVVTPIRGKHQFGDLAHAKKAAQKVTGSKLTWKKRAAVGVFAGAVNTWNGCDPSDELLFKIVERRRVTTKRKRNPEHEVRELILFAENSYALHGQYNAIMKNLSRKYKRGVYDPAKAAVLWKYWIDEAVKHYNKEILGGPLSLRQSVFTVQDRKDAAKAMEKQERSEVKSGEYLKNPLTKKGRKILRRMQSEYGPDKGKQVFYASIEKGTVKGAERKTNMARKKKRTAKQLANDRRLGRMAKARAKAARKKKARKKTARRKVRRKANPKRTSNKKSHLWIVFRCKRATYGTGVSIAYLGPGKTGTPKFGPRSRAFVFQVKSAAEDMARKYATGGFHVGIASKNKTGAQLMSFCKELAKGK